MNAGDTSSSEISSQDMIQKEILGEHYFRKNNLGPSLDIFLSLYHQHPKHYKYGYYLGKIYYRLGDIDKAAHYLSKSRQVNPLQRQTLLLLHHCYSRKKKYRKAFTCILDLYILAKEVKDQNILYYEKRIRTTSRKIDGFSAGEKARLFKQRVQHLQIFFEDLEARITSEKGAKKSSSPAHLPVTPNKSLVLPEDNEQDEVEPQEEDETDPLALAKAAKQAEALAKANGLIDAPKKAPDIKQTSPEENIAFDIEQEAPHKLFHSLSQAPQAHSQSDQTPPTVPAPQEEEKAQEQEQSKPLSSQDMQSVLLQVAFLRQVSPDKHKKIQQFTSILRFEDGQTVFAENDPVFGFHILLNGEGNIHKGGQVIHRYSAPNLIDEDDFFRVTNRSFSFVAQGPCEVLFFNKTGYQNFFQRDPEVAIAFLWHFTQSLSQKIDSCIEEILLQTPNDRFIEELEQKHELSNLRKLTPQEIHTLRALFKPISLKKNDKIYEAQEDRKNFFVLIEGCIQCTHPQRHPMVIEKAEYFGEMVFCGPGYPHLFDARVSSEQAQLLQISYQQLAAMAKFEQSDQKFLADLLVRILSNKSKELRELLYQTQYLKNKG